MPRTIALLALAALSCALLATAALRAGEPPRVAKPAEATAPTAPAKDLPQFTALDVNRDTSISAAEARAHAGLAAIFAECDADRNGSLSTWEFAEARSKLRQ